LATLTGAGGDTMTGGALDWGRIARRATAAQTAHAAVMRSVRMRRRGDMLLRFQNIRCSSMAKSRSVTASDCDSCIRQEMSELMRVN
jgi:hypothetical protein